MGDDIYSNYIIVMQLTGNIEGRVEISIKLMKGGEVLYSD